MCHCEEPKATWQSPLYGQRRLMVEIAALPAVARNDSLCLSLYQIWYKKAVRWDVQKRRGSRKGVRRRPLKTHPREHICRHHRRERTDQIRSSVEPGVLACISLTTALAPPTGRNLVPLHRTFLAIGLGSCCVRRAKDGARRAFVLFAPRSSPSETRPRCKRAVFDENQTALVKLH